MPRAYYNDSDKYAAQWLRNLIAAGAIADGDVDVRSIKDVTAGDLNGYTQHHFFAGAGGWSLALRMAGWPDGEPVWTGSCPCQPWSKAGKRAGASDHRHLWPEWFRLAREYRPAIIFGEQVAGAWSWLDGVFADLEGIGYACGAADLPAASVGSLQDRPRLWFLSYPEGERRQSWAGLREGNAQLNGALARNRAWWDAEPEVGRVADGLPAGVDQRRALGNAIVPQLAAEFILAAAQAA